MPASVPASAPPLAPAAPQAATNPGSEAADAAAPRSASAKPATAGATTTRVELEKIDRVVNMVGELVIAQAMLGQVVHTLPEDAQRPAGAGSRRGRSSHARAQRQRDVDARAAGERRVPAHAAIGPRTGDEDVQESPSRNGGGKHRGRPIDHRTPRRSAHAHHPQFDRSRHRIAVGSSGSRKIRGRNDPTFGRAPRRPHRHRDQRRRRRHQLRTGAGKRPAIAGWSSAEATLSEDEINNLIFLPGFSTAEKVSDISGRGVGMDVVRRNIQDVGGRISLKSDRGRGMTIQLALPLTLAVMDGMVIRVGQETYVMPMSAIVECLRPPASDIHNLIGTPGMLRLRGNLVPLVQLSELLDIGVTPSAGDERVVIITDAGEGAHFGIVVGRIVRPSAGRRQKHRGELRLRSRHRRRHHPRQWPGRVHSRRRETVRSCQQPESSCRRSPAPPTGSPRWPRP